MQEAISLIERGQEQTRGVTQPSAQQRTRLLIVCQLFYPELVSTGQTLTELAEQLAALGVDVEVLCGPPTVLGRRKKVPKRLEHKGIRVRRVWGTRFPKLSLLGRVVNQVSFVISAFLYLLWHRPKKPILVLTNPPFLAMACAVLRRLRLGPPYIYLVFDVYPDTAIHLGLLREEAWLTRLWERLNLSTYKRAAGIIVIGRCMRDVIVRKLSQGGLAVDGKLHHIPVWCDDEAIAFTDAGCQGLAEELGVKNKFVVGYFGNMGRFHDIETIMAAAERLRDEPDVVFLFVGDGHKKQWAVDRARERGLHNCKFHGYVAREQLGHLLHLADVGLVSLLEGQEGLSVPSKTFGLMAAGVPVLAVMSECSEIAQVVSEEACGQVIRPGDSLSLAEGILEYYRNKSKRQSAGQRSIDAIRNKYNLHEVAVSYRQLIESVRDQAKTQR